MRRSVIVVAAPVLLTAVAPGARGAEIHEAVKAGNLAQVQALVEKGGAADHRQVPRPAEREVAAAVAALNGSLRSAGLEPVVVK